MPRSAVLQDVVPGPALRRFHPQPKPKPKLITNPNPHPIMNPSLSSHRPILLACLTGALALTGIGCRDQESSTFTPPSTLDRRPIESAEPTGQEGGSWFARLTGFQKALEAKTAEVAAAEAAAHQAERQVQAIQVLLDGQREATDQARRGQSFWRVAASVLSALTIVAIFVGAAIGSFARQHRHPHHPSSRTTPDADALTHLV